MTNPLAQATSELLEILSPLGTDDRFRVVRAALTLLGEEMPTRSASAMGGKGKLGTDDEEENLSDGLSAAAKVWARKHQIDREQLDHYFHFDQGKVVPISLAGTTKKKSEQVENTYLTQGMASFIATGDAAFTDDEARALCEHFGCYDTTNHAKYVKGFGNRITGSKSSGWKLTVPGFSAFADLVKAP